MSAHPAPARAAVARRASAALRYAALGWPVLPLHTPEPDGGCSCHAPDCTKPGKHPRSRRGLLDATTSAARVAAWWKTWPDANVGVATGQLLVLDIDGEDGHTALADLETAHGPLPATLTATTSRGAHFYFAAGEHRIGNSTGRLGTGVDVRGHGGYVIVPPSQHADGHRYRWGARRGPAPIPAWLAERLAPVQRGPAPPRREVPPPEVSDRKERYFQAALRAELGDVARAQAGSRNNTLNRAAFRLAQLTASGHGPLDALPELLLQAAVAAGLSEPEALATIHSGLQAGQQHPRPTPLAP